MAKSETAKLLEFNKNAEWVAKVNCYGFALGVDLEERHALDYTDIGPHPGELSRKFRNPKVAGAMRSGHDLQYLLLADGLIPLSMAEALDIPDEEGAHVLAAIDYHFFRRVMPRHWIHKGGNMPIQKGFGSQKRIGDINKALVECSLLWGPAAMCGFYRVPANRLRLGATEPLPYHERTATALAGHLEVLWETAAHRPMIEQEIESLGLSPELPKHFKMGEAARTLRTAMSFRLPMPKFGR